MKKHVCSLIVAGLTLSPLAQAQLSSMVSSAGSCTSQGAWTQRALETASAIAQTIENLQKDDNCKKLADQFIKPPAPVQIDQDTSAGRMTIRPESFLQELAALKSVLQNSSQDPQAANVLGPLMTAVTIDSLDNSVKTSANPAVKASLDALKARFQAASEQALTSANSLFQSLPQYERCLQERPDLLASVVANSVQLASAVASGGPLISNRLSQTIGNFLNFLQDKKFAKMLKNLDKLKFWSDLSCLIETTQTNYCSVQDGFQLLEDQKKAVNASWSDSPLQGYYIMNREVPQITNWLQQIQMGIEPRLLTDAAFKNTTWMSMIKLFQDINQLPAMYHENFIVYTKLTSMEQKQQNIRTLLMRLTSAMAGEGLAGGSSTNFFDLAVPSMKIPFFLLGRDEIPAEIIANGANKIDTESYLLSLDLTYELKTPDETMAKILVRIKDISNRAMVAGADYFRTRMNVDQINLVDEAHTSSAITSVDALRNVRQYLNTLYRRLIEEPESRAVLTSLLDTMTRIDIILGNFDKLYQISNNLISDLSHFQTAKTRASENANDLSDFPHQKREEYTHAFEGLIGSIYENLNILLQRDGFFTTRMSTYVRHEYYVRAKKQNEDFGQYTSQLIITAGKNLIDKLQEYQSFNIAAAQKDLENAQVINMNNLDTLEEFVIPYMEDYLISLNKRSGHFFAKTTTNIGFFVPFYDKYVILTSNQDPNGAAEGMRAKVCMQTLGFKNYERFFFLCQGAQLSSVIEAKNGIHKLQLSFNYNQLFKQKNKGESIGNKLLPNFQVFPSSNRFANTCVLRDFFRNNLVSLMTQKFNQR